MGGFGTREDLLAGYEAEAGRRVDPDTLRWWEAMGTLKWGVICMLQARAHLDGQSRSVELAAIGRRVCETEHDLFLLLPGGRPDFPEPEAAPLEVPHDRPTAQELSEAVGVPGGGRGREHRRSGAISLSGRGQRPRHHRARAGAGARGRRRIEPDSTGSGSRATRSSPRPSVAAPWTSGSTSASCGRPSWTSSRWRTLRTPRDSHAFGHAGRGGLSKKCGGA